MRRILAFACAAASLLFLGIVTFQPALGQDLGPPGATPWQDTITSQIEAFRHKDAPGAFQYAARSYHQTFATPESFFAVIMGTGYSPIMESRSYSFGGFRRLGDKAVLQEVKLTGNDLALYELFYQLAEEEDGWRVQGVRLIKQPGMGI